MIGAAHPIAANVGKIPTNAVDIPMTVSVMREGVFSSDQIANPSKDERSKRPHYKAHTESQEDRQQCRHRISGRKKQAGKNGGQRPVDVEVVPFEDSA